MTQTHPKSAGSAEPPHRDARSSLVDRTAELSEDVLASVEKGQRAALEAVRKFVATVDDIVPAIGSRPTRRDAVIESALEMADNLVTTQYEFLRSVVRSADRALTSSTSPK